MNSQALLKYSAPVPRYTSYPTAPNFGQAVGPTTHADWLAALGPGQDLSLYFHVPFCRSLCWFCGCNMTVANDPRIAEAYADLLVRELKLVAGAAAQAGPVRHIHWGGGTPLEIGERALRSVMDNVVDAFEIAADAEIAVEIDPRTLTAEFAHTLGQTGFNRASLGVQDIDPAVQAAVNRVQPLAITRSAVEVLRSNGIEKLNIDLMVGLPRQTASGVRKSAAVIADSLRPDRVSVFSYAHVPWMKRHQKLIDATSLPSSSERLRQTRVVEETLIDRGYVPVGLDHFSLPGDRLAQAASGGELRRNFQGYVTDQSDALIGIGASAISSLPQGYCQNQSKVPDYRKALDNGDFATIRGVKLTKSDRVRRDIIERLMCDLRVDLNEVTRRWHVSPREFDSAVVALSPMVEDGLVSLTKGRIEISDNARPVVRSVCSVFDAYLQPQPTMHADGI